MLIKVYRNNELEFEEEIKSVKEYQRFVNQEFGYLRNEGYEVKVEGTI